MSTNLRQHRLTWHRSALPANPTSSRPRSWSLGNATLVVVERSGWRRVLGASKPRPSAKGAHPYRKRACLEALRLATTKLTQRGTGYTSWGHPTQLRISRGSAGLIPAKNATKPNPFKIISLRPTRKENNWETEETMERATVTHETERG
jgi:hypothetical protein